jgi:hypothetical protein
LTKIPLAFPSTSPENRSSMSRPNFSTSALYKSGWAAKSWDPYHVHNGVDAANDPPANPCVIGETVSGVTGDAVKVPGTDKLLQEGSKSTSNGVLPNLAATLFISMCFGKLSKQSV